MRILGVDPGTLFTGYAVIEDIGGKLKVLESDVIKNPSRDSLPLRLKNIYDTLVAVIREYLPDEFAIETAFYSKNVQSTLKLGHARGVSILAAVNNEIPTTEYSPREVKKSVVGIGSASKEQVRYMVCQLLRLRSSPKSLDISDALAVAVCHYNKLIRYTTNNHSWKDYVKQNPKKVKFHSFR
jgi:crossover junction endodeoxyribonuclease RuvC